MAWRKAATFSSLLHRCGRRVKLPTTRDFCGVLNLTLPRTTTSVLRIGDVTVETIGSSFADCIKFNDHLRGRYHLAFFCTSLARFKKVHHMPRRKAPKKTSASSPSSYSRFTQDDDEEEEDFENDSTAEYSMEDDRPFHQLRSEFETLAAKDGYSVFVVQPDYQLNEREISQLGIDLSIPTDALLAEAVSLVDSLSTWSVVGSTVQLVEGLRFGLLFGRQGADEVLELIEAHRAEISAVFVNHERLTYTQRIKLEEWWRLPVFDRYSTVLRIFNERAKTKEAKLQIALAEIPYMRSQLGEFRSALLQDSKSASSRGLSMMGGAGETPFEVRRRLLNDRERQLTKMLESVVERRAAAREGRRQRLGMPVVAVVGYTNSGKTSLIKALTNEVGLEPQDRLFATLDVTTHECLTPSGIKYLLTDTVGFLSNLPTFLVASFGATLDDAVAADILLHVRDVSHPCFRQQKTNVLSTLETLGVTPEKMESNYLETWNKIDLVEEDWLRWEEKVLTMEAEKSSWDAKVDASTDAPTTPSPRDPTSVVAPCQISATEKTGLADLNQLIEDKIVTKLGYKKRVVVIDLTDQPVLSWLMKETTVMSIDPLEAAEPGQNLMMVKIWMSPSASGKFQKHFPDYVVKDL